MNKEYIYEDGEALIIDENNNQTKTEYYDNLDEALAQENLIEIMENEIQRLEAKLAKSKKSFLLSKILSWDILVMSVAVPLIGGPIGGLLLDIPHGFALGLFSAAGLSIPGTLMSLIQYRGVRDEEKAQNASKVKLECLQKNLIEQKEHLKTLKSDKTNSKDTEDFYVSVVQDKEKIEEFWDLSSFYYALGYDEKKYFRSFQKGELGKALKKSATEEEIQEANEYFKEKEPILVKKIGRPKRYSQNK